MRKIGESELILNPDGSIYHLKLRPENIGETIILVGDQDRVEKVSKFFDTIDFKVKNREFVTHTGTLRGKKVSAISTGIGTDNIDIVVNELDALVNIDLETRTVKEKHTSLNLVRIGTSGSLQAEIPVENPVVAKYAVGFDGLLNYYADRNKACNLELEKAFVDYTKWNEILPAPYFVKSSDDLFNKIEGEKLFHGITIAAPGFYGPQGRVLRLPVIDPEINTKLPKFTYENLKITNYEMESSALYGLSKLLGHKALVVCLIVANRMRKEYSSNYKSKIEDVIKYILDKLID